MNEDLKRKYEGMTNGDLAKILTKDRSQYTEEAINLAESIYLSRGLDLSNAQKVLIEEEVKYLEEKREAEINYKFRKAEKRIEDMYIISLISGVIICILSLLSILGITILGSTGWGLIDAAIIIMLSAGLRKKSRVCALIMFIYFLLITILSSYQNIDTQLITARAFFCIIFLYGFIGTLTYHKYQDVNKSI
jgi:hypothetical protein